MGGLFGGGAPKIPPPQPVKPAPLDPAAVEATRARDLAAEETRKKVRSRASTIFTSPTGVAEEAPVATKQLLGV